jgi:DnaD/phage-associated family protein
MMMSFFNANLKDITIPSDDAEKLVLSGNGNACLYYICAHLYGQDSVPAIAQHLNWSQEKTLAARTTLEAMGLCKSICDEPPANENLPTYTPKEVNTIADGDPVFKSLIEYTKIRLNRLLTPTDLRTLLGLYNHLGLPAGVIMLLISYTVEHVRKRRGETARVGMSHIESEGFFWHRHGIVTEAAAEEYIRKKAEEDDRIMTLARLLNIRNRTPTVTEEKYLVKWSGYGMHPDVIYTAYDKTVVKTGSLKWSYMNRILETWHTKGIRTPEDLQRVERTRTVTPSGVSEHTGGASGKTAATSNKIPAQNPGGESARAGENAAERLKRIRTSRGAATRESESR